MGPLHSTSLYITLPGLYSYLLDSILLYNGSTSLFLILHYSTMALLHSIWFFIILPLFPFFTLLDSTLLYNGSVHSTWIYITLPGIYSTLLDSTLLCRDYTPLYLTLHCTTMALLHSTWPYITLPWLYSTQLDSTLLNLGSTPLYLTLHY